MQQVYPAQLKCSLQKSSETAHQFDAVVVLLVRLVYPAAPVDFLGQLPVEIFIDSRRDPKTQQALR